MNKRGRIGVIITVVLIVLVFAAAIYFSFFFYYKCAQSDLACYLAHQEKCAKTKFINDEAQTTWNYKIIGKNDERCDVEVKILKMKQGSIDKINLEGKDMICSISVGSKIRPEENLNICHGLLKEKIQEIMINNAHAYIISNMGKISGELNQSVV